MSRFISKLVSAEKTRELTKLNTLDNILKKIREASIKGEYRISVIVHNSTIELISQLKAEGYNITYYRGIPYTSVDISWEPENG